MAFILNLDAQLICAFVFENAKSRVSHDTAHTESGEKKCILMMILLEINAFNILNKCLYQNENPTFLPCQVGNTFLSNIFLRFSGCGHRIFFCWHGHFSYLLDSRRADIC